MNLLFITLKVEQSDVFTTGSANHISPVVSSNALTKQGLDSFSALSFMPQTGAV